MSPHSGFSPRTPIRTSRRAGDRWKTVQLKDHQPAEALVMPLNSTLVVDNAGATRFQAAVGVDVSSFASDINPRVRFFVFGEEPDRRQLVKVTGEPPVESSGEPFTVARLFR